MAIISNKMIDMLNYRIQQEELSSRLYLSMSIWLEWSGFTGASQLWKKYSDEETTHAKMAYDYLIDLNIKPIVPGLVEQTQEFKSLPQIIAKSYEHEVKITQQCNELAKSAMLEGDHLTYQLALKYVTEQVDELAKTNLLIDQLELFGDDKIALRLLDNYILENLL